MHLMYGADVLLLILTNKKKNTIDCSKNCYRFTYFCFSGISLLRLMDIFPNKRATVSNYTTRNAQNYSIPKCRLELYKSSFVLTVVDKWNTLSTDVRETDSVRIFKEKIHVSVKNENVLTCRTRPNFFLHMVIDF